MPPQEEDGRRRSPPSSPPEHQNDETSSKNSNYYHDDSIISVDLDEKQLNEIKRRQEAHPRANDDIKDTTIKQKTIKSSVLTFRNLSFHAGKERTILDNISGSVHSGQTLAIMGPSGSGKTTFLKALTMEPTTPTSLFGHQRDKTHISGSCFLNGAPLTRQIVRDHFFVVKQTDQHWPYLTVWETLQFACRLDQVPLPHQHDIHSSRDAAEKKYLQEIIDKMGLSNCQDTRAEKLSGGQQRRLSIALGLVQQPLVLILDEPTTGLDSAAASKIVQEMMELSARENLLTICTIHQPSSRIFAQFDQLMLLSQGRVAYHGPIGQVESYFDQQLGFPTPPETNPAEFYLDLVNADFSSDSQVQTFLNHWKKHVKKSAYTSSSSSESTFLGTTSHSSMTGSNDFSEDSADQSGQTDNIQQSSLPKVPLVKLQNVRKDPLIELRVLFHRQWVLMVRDPLVYVGRAVGMLFVCSVLASVYVSIRSNSQDQSVNKLWFLCWLCVMPSQFGCVAVLGLNQEFKSIQRETNNGSFSRSSYALTKVLTLPIMLVFALCSMGIPFYGIAGAPGASFVHCLSSLTAVTFVMDSVAECCAVWIDDSILGMLCYMAYWFGLSIFGGILISVDDLYQPFELLFRLWPGSYYVRSSAHFYFKYTEFEPCVRENNPDAVVCVNSSDGLEVLDGLSVLFPLVKSTETFLLDMGVMLSIGIFFKLVYVLGIMFKGNGSTKRQFAAIDSPNQDHSVKF